jgi:hypothetical protein
MLCGFVAASSTAFGATPHRVTWGHGVTARVMLKPGETLTFLHGALQTGEAVGCVNRNGYGVTTTVPRYSMYARHLPPTLAALVGYAHASKPGDGSVTIRITRPSSTTVLVTCR